MIFPRDMGYCHGWPKWCAVCALMTMQFAAEAAYDVVSPGPSVRTKRRANRRPPKRLTQPADLREGVANAVTIVSDVSNSSLHL